MNIEIIEKKIRHDYNQMRVTTVQFRDFTETARHLAKNRRSSTWSISRHLGMPCAHMRKILKQMEKMDYVTSDSNGSNNIYWELKE